MTTEHAPIKPRWRDSLRRYWWAWVSGGAIFVVAVFTDWFDYVW